MYLTEKSRWTFRELLTAIDIKELWYILSMRHNLPPLREERLFKAYRDARREMLGLPIVAGKGDILHCEIVVNEEDGGAPEVRYSSRITLIDDEEQYGFELSDWAELIDCEVDGNCLQKYGALIVTAELLWEMTFCGFDRKTVLSNAKRIIGSDESECGASTEDVHSNLEAESSQKEPNAMEWFINAPESIKTEIFEMLKIHALNKTNDEVTDEDFMAIINDWVKESAYEYKGCETAMQIIYHMLSSLDYDDMAYLAKLLKNEGEIFNGEH